MFSMHAQPNHQASGGNPNAIAEALERLRARRGLSRPAAVDPEPDAPAVPAPKSAEERINGELLELGNFLTLMS